MSGCETKSHTPRVSVVMPAYNCEKYIGEAIGSVLNQTMRDWELIVIDDCSKDGTCRIVEELAAKDSRIRLVRNEKNLGPAGSRNKGLDLAAGQYIALLDSDDLWRSEKLEKQLQLAEEKNADFIYCSYAIMDENGKKRSEDYVVPLETDLKAMLATNVVGCSTVMLSAEILRDRRFSSEFYHEDYALWLKILQQIDKAWGIVEVQVDYRVQANSRAGNKLRSARHRWEIYRNLLHLSLPKSVYYMSRYALAGFRKYRVTNS